MASFYLEADHFDFSRPSSAGVPKGTKYDYVYTGKKGGQYIGGTNGNDKITDQSGNDNIYGFGGNDYIKAGLDKYKTCIDGGSGNDTILFGKNDAVTGGKGADKFIPQFKKMEMFLIADFSKKEGDSLELKNFISNTDKLKYAIEVVNHPGTQNDVAYVWQLTKPNVQWKQIFNFEGKAVEQFMKDTGMKKGDGYSYITGKAMIDYFMNEGKNSKLTKGEFEIFDPFDVVNQEGGQTNSSFSDDFIL